MSAFLEPFYKPKADGTPGPVVKKIKVFKKQTSGVPVRENGRAANYMVRIDVFCEENKGKKKYYFVPIYVSDVVKKRLPNKAVVAHKSEADWKVMDENNFLFSLYSNDLIYIESRGEEGVNFCDIDKSKFPLTSFFAYYKSADIANGNIADFDM